MAHTEERGVLLVHPDDRQRMQAWLRTSDKYAWISVKYNLGEFPAIQMETISKTEAELACHINNNFIGWIGHYIGISWVSVDPNGVISKPYGVQNVKSFKTDKEN